MNLLITVISAEWKFLYINILPTKLLNILFFPSFYNYEKKFMLLYNFYLIQNYITNISLLALLYNFFIVIF